MDVVFIIPILYPMDIIFLPILCYVVRTLKTK